MNKKKPGIPSKAKQVIEAYTTNINKTDPQGSYTGVPMNKNEKPVLDHDDM